MNLGVLAKDMRGRFIPLGRIQIQRGLELLDGFGDVPSGQMDQAEQAMADNLTRFIFCGHRRRVEQLGGRQGEIAVAAADRVTELPEQKREYERAGRTFLAKLQPALAASQHLFRSRTGGGREGTDQGGLEALFQGFALHLIGDLREQAEPALDVRDRFDVCRAPHGRSPRVKPRLDRLADLARRRQMVGEDLRYHRAAIARPKHFGDPGMRRPALGLNHRIVRGPLQQGMAELVARLRGSFLNAENIGLHQLIENLAMFELPIVEQKAKRLRRERSTKTGRHLHDPPAGRQPIKPFRHHLRQRQRHDVVPARRPRRTALVVDQRQHQLLDEQRVSVGERDRAVEQFRRQRVATRNGTRQLQALIFRKRLQLDDFIRRRQGQFMAKGPRRDEKQDGCLGDSR